MFLHFAPTRYCNQNNTTIYGLQQKKINFGKKVARRDIILTVDTKDDFEFVKDIYYLLKKKGGLNNSFLAERIVDLINNNEISRKKIILLRADGSKEKGMGDLISLMNIIEPLKKDFKFIFASKSYPEGISFIKKQGFEVLSLPTDSQSSEEINDGIGNKEHSRPGKDLTARTQTDQKRLASFDCSRKSAFESVH